MADFKDPTVKSGPLKGQKVFRTFGIVVVVIAVLAAISWYTGLFAALS